MRFVVTLLRLIWSRTTASVAMFVNARRAREKFWFAVRQVVPITQRAGRYMTMNFAQNAPRALPQGLARFLNGALWLLLPLLEP